jgi:hypothetical protein
MRHVVRRAAVLTTSSMLAFTGVGAVAAPAWAGSDESIGSLRGVVTWYSNGDKIQAADIKKDGRSIEANYRVGRYGGLHVLHVAGRGNKKTRVWDLREGTDIQIRMCYRKGWAVLACSGWQKAEA